MKGKKLLTVMGQIDDKYILEAAPAEKRRGKSNRVAWYITAACLCAAVSAGIIVNTMSRTTETGQIRVSYFEASEPAHGVDAFGEDELHHVDIILNSNRLYVQLGESEYEMYGIGKTVDEEDFGERIGVIQEIDSYSEAVETPCSQEPNLAGCEVYRFEPAGCEAVVIVKGDDRCALFIHEQFTEMGHGLNEEYLIFGAKTAEDIEYIRYEHRKLGGEVAADGKITDRSDIESVFEITSSLTPYTTDDPRIGTPNWLNKAREVYFEDKENVLFVDLEIVFRNGLSMEFGYQPNLGTGFVDGHHFLTGSQNEVMEDVFSTNG